MRKAQSAVEASLIISFMLLVFVLFVGVFTIRMKYIQDKQQEEGFMIMAENIGSEIEIANNVEKGYQRNFSLPAKAGGLEFNVTLINSTVLGGNHTELVLQSLASRKLTHVETIKLNNVFGQICTGPEYLNTIKKDKNRIILRCKVL